MAEQVFDLRSRNSTLSSEFHKLSFEDFLQAIHVHILHTLINKAEFFFFGNDEGYCLLPKEFSLGWWNG
jgi:hypothetical protein